MISHCGKLIVERAFDMRRRFAVIVIISVMTLLACSGCGQASAQTTVNKSPETTEQVTVSPSAEAADSPTPPESTEPTLVAEPTIVPAEGEDNCATAISDRAKSFFTLPELDMSAEVVITGECIKAEPVFQNDTLYTLSQIKVVQVFKGNITSGDSLFFVEFGGRVTNGEYNKGCNLPPIPKSAQATVDKEIVYGIDWYYPLKEGENVLLFAGDSSGFLAEFDQPLYAVIGDYDGKFFLQDDGSYAKPLPAETDKHVFGDGSLIITMNELAGYYQ